jgi:hypothetical protein
VHTLLILAPALRGFKPASYMLAPLSGHAVFHAQPRR